MLTGNGARPRASIVSNSWQIPVGEVPAQTVHAIDLRAAAEGVGMYFASGDTPGLTVTDSDPYATAVGGTTLGIGARNNRVFETGWSDDYATLDAGTWSDVGVGAGSGGGTSGVWGQPAYQKGVVPASMSRVRVGKRIVTGRAVPDIAADGDPDSGILTGYIASGTDAHPGPYQTEVNAGTSLATPLVAGLVADAQQGQKSAFGFINPLIYRLAGTPGVPRHPAGHRLDAAAGPGRLGGGQRRRQPGRRRLRLPGARLHPAGDRQGLRHDDRRRHARRRRLHHRAAPRRRLLPMSPRAGTTGPFGEIKIFIPNESVASPPGSALSAGGGSQAVEEEGLQPPGRLVRAPVVRQLLCQQRAQDDDVARGDVRADRAVTPAA